MPEGDTIHKLANRLRTLLADAPLVTARLDGRPIADFPGTPVDAIHAIGKHLFIQVGDRVVRSHLGMTGSWVHSSPDAARLAPGVEVSIELSTHDITVRCLRAKEVEVLDVRGQKYRGWLRYLGPDVAAENFDPTISARRARARLRPDTPLVDLLLDQRVAAGIGNVYKCETLFLEAQPPLLPIAAIDDAELEKLFHVAHRLLCRNLRPGPRRTRAAYPNATTTSDDDAKLWVYGRTNEACLLCAAPIHYERLGRHRRATWWCKRCQSGRNSGM